MTGGGGDPGNVSGLHPPSEARVPPSPRTHCVANASPRRQGSPRAGDADPGQSPPSQLDGGGLPIAPQPPSASPRPAPAAPSLPTTSQAHFVLYPPDSMPNAAQQDPSGPQAPPIVLPQDAVDLPLDEIEAALLLMGPQPPQDSPVQGSAFRRHGQGSKVKRAPGSGVSFNMGKPDDHEQRQAPISPKKSRLQTERSVSQGLAQAASSPGSSPQRTVSKEASSILRSPGSRGPRENSRNVLFTPNTAAGQTDTGAPPTTDPGIAPLVLADLEETLALLPESSQLPPRPFSEMGANAASSSVGDPAEGQSVPQSPARCLMRSATASVVSSIKRRMSQMSNAAEKALRSKSSSGAEGPVSPVIDPGGTRSRRQSIVQALSQTLLGPLASNNLAAQPSADLGRSGGGKSRRASLLAFFTMQDDSNDDPTAPATAPHTPARSGVTSGVPGKSRRPSVIQVLGNLVTGVKTEDLEDQDDPFFTSLDQFKPIDFMYRHTKSMRMYFACSKKTGRYYVLKKYPKDGMEISVERRIRGAVGLAEEISHPNLITLAGNWENDEAIYVVEEYASHGDLLQDSLSCPEKYTEKYVALNIVKPLLQALVYLHHKHIVHRSLYPENLLLDRQGKLRVGKYSSMVNMEHEDVTERSDFLDYMAPEMLSHKDESERMAAGASTASGAGPSLRSRKSRKQAARAASRANVLQHQGTTGVLSSNDDRGTSVTMTTEDGYSRMATAGKLGSFEEELLRARSRRMLQNIGEGVEESGRESEQGCAGFATMHGSTQPGQHGLHGGPVPVWCSSEQPMQQDIGRGRASPPNVHGHSPLPVPPGIGKGRIRAPCTMHNSSTSQHSLRPGIGRGHSGQHSVQPAMQQAGHSGGQHIGPQAVCEGTELEEPSVRGGERSIRSLLRIAEPQGSMSERSARQGSRFFESAEPTPLEPRASRPYSFFSALASTFKRMGTTNLQEGEDGDGGGEGEGEGSVREYEKSRHSTLSYRSQKSTQMEMIVPNNAWEWQDAYDEKVDIWQVGCLVHELLCGCLPFESDDKLLASALILWADVTVFPDNLSPQCVAFIQACLIKNPELRPTAEELLRHEWVIRHEAGEELQSQAALVSGKAASVPVTLLSTWEAGGGVLGLLARAVKTVTSVISPAVAAAVQLTTLPGNAVSRPADLYRKGNLQAAMGKKVDPSDYYY